MEHISYQRYHYHYYHIIVINISFKTDKLILMQLCYINNKLIRVDCDIL